MTVREAMLANPQPRAPPAVHAPTVHAGDDGDDESFSPTESDAGSSSSFLSAESDLGSVSDASGNGERDGDARRGTGGGLFEGGLFAKGGLFEETTEPGRREVAAAVSHRAGHAAAGQVPRQVQNRGWVREPERGKRRRKERHRQRGRERGTAGRSRRRRAGKVLGRNVARAGRRVRLVAPSVLLLQGRGAPVGCRLGLGARRGLARPERLGRVRLGARRGVRGSAGLHPHPAHARGEEQEADAAEGRPVIVSGSGGAPITIGFCLRASWIERENRPSVQRLRRARVPREPADVFPERLALRRAHPERPFLQQPPHVPRARRRGQRPGPLPKPGARVV